eukprot:236804_1
MAVNITRKDSPMFIASANALAGACGGIIAMTMVFPLDTIRTQLQAKPIQCESKEEKEPFKPPEKIGIRQVVNKIYRKEGISGFYRALGSQLICIFVSDMVYFFSVTLIKQILYGKREVDAIANLKASTIAGIINVFCTSPFWRAQVQLMLQSKKLKMDSIEENEIMNGLIDAWKRIYSRDGINGLYKGVGPSLWLVSNPIIQFVAYEEIVNILKRYNNTLELSAATYFCCGAAGKAIATFMTYPLQVMQTQLRKKDSQFKDMKHCINTFLIPKLKNGDFEALYSGFFAKLYQTVSNSAIKFMIYEKVLEFTKVLLRWMQRALIAMIFFAFVSKTKNIQQKSAVKVNV